LLVIIINKIMKNNRKNRKLKFIREKNDLRLGRTTFAAHCKISNLTTDLYTHLNDLVILAKKQLFKKYKLSLPNTVISNGICDDDFIRNVKTYKVTLSLK